MKNLLFLLPLLVVISCSDNNAANISRSKDSTITTSKSDSSKSANLPIAEAATILSRKQVPVLCYHHIRDVETVSKSSMGYDVTLTQFKAQLKTLADSGYKTIL